MDSPVGQRFPSGHTLQGAEQSLDQHVKGIRSQIRQQKQRHAQMGDGQSRQQDPHADSPFL